MDSTGHFTRLEGEECRQLVRDHSVGRVAWPSASGLQVLPVAYVTDGERILFRTDPASVLGELRRPMPVAFEVDDIDVATATGWSVLIHGLAEAYPQEPPALLSWAPGDRTLVIAITPSTYSGRAVSAEESRS